MKKLLNTLYINQPETYLSLDGENVVVLKEDEILLRLPLHNIEAIVTFGYTGASPALMRACAERSIDLVFMSSTGRFLARVTGEVKGNVLLRKKQYRVSDNEEESLEIAKNFMYGKFYNSRWVLERAIRDHGIRIDVDRVKHASNLIYECLKRVENIRTLDGLRGIEGEVAHYYFGVFDELILQNKEYFQYNGRSRKPPKDAINAMLSFIYTVLANDVSAKLESVGLDPYVGFMHRDRPGRVSLALDVMEELRSIIADRFVLTLVNQKIVNKNSFETMENGAVLIKKESRKLILAQWQERKKDTIMHPFLKEKISWGMVPYTQALILSRYLRGDLDAYPPFFWK